MQHNVICVVLQEKNYIRKEPEFILLRGNRLLIFKRMVKRNTEVKKTVFLFD
ncbi:hypothetical protein EC917_12921 [Bacillus thuringiensis]|uniref:Uncharacterized protein n=1 Tax=Bacillus thuringiensis TaxID=1428 RepID=A0A4R4B0M1_BACTU|nr:hypothetical protein EC917_12921 [Bacillus thuringiensis]TCW46297.1 hypothetical protein EC910_12821 [Bacillus thuringiensis]